MIKLIIALVLGALLSLPVHAQDSSLTPLDKLHVEVNAERLKPNDFYLKMMDTPLFVFVASQKDKVNIDGMVEISFRSSLFNEKPVINVFDTYNRAKKFGDDRGLPKDEILKVEGGAAFTFMKVPYYLFLNPETEHEKFFSPEEIDFVKTLTDAFEIGSFDNDIFENLKPELNALPRLVSAIKLSVTDIQSVERVYICENPLVPIGADNVKNHLLVIQVHKKGDQDVIRRLIYQDIQPFIERGQFVDFVFVNKKKRKKIIPKEHKYIFKR